MYQLAVLIHILSAIVWIGRMAFLAPVAAVLLPSTASTVLLGLAGLAGLAAVSWLVFIGPGAGRGGAGQPK